MERSGASCELTDHEGDGTTFPGPKAHKCTVNAPHERTLVMLVLVVVDMMVTLRHLALVIGRSANERHGHDTDETIVDFMLATHRGVSFDERKAQGFPESVGNRNRFGTHTSTAEAVFLVTAGVINLVTHDGGREVSDVGITVDISRSVSQTYAGDLCDYDTDRTGANMLSCRSAK